MDEKEVQAILIQILSATVNETEINPRIAGKITPEKLLSIYHLAKKHDLAHVLSRFVYQNKLDINQDLQSKLQYEEFSVIYRYEQIKYAFEQICNSFDEEKIAYVPLKGSLLRPYYPYESMRTSCDIDILIHDSDLDAAIACLKSRGFRYVGKRYHDVLLCSPNKVHLELHFNIQENVDSLDVVLKDAWQYARLTKDSRYDFKKEFFVFHMYAHMAYHFLSGGCGIRSLLDIWIMEHKMDASYLCAEILLKKAGIYKFAAEMSAISNECFTDSTQDTFDNLVLRYICRGGAYGSKENGIAVQKSKTNSSFLYVLKRLFMPYKYMVMIYPTLKKVPCLLPFCWGARLVRAIFEGKSRGIKTEIIYMNELSDQKINEINEICSRLGL